MAKAKSKKSKPKGALKGTAGIDSPDFEARLERVLQLMGKHQLAELQWENENERIHLRTLAGSMPAPNWMSPVAAAVMPQVPADFIKTVSTPTNHKQILSPFVGTFYRAPSPTTEPYAREGQMIKEGSVLCIVEAMKLMNEIEAEFAGKILQVLVENGQPVEFGEPLFLIEIS